MRPAIRAICQTVAECYGFYSADEILVRDKHKSICEARSVAMWLARRKFGLSYPELGREFAMDHTTCMNAVRRVENAGGLLRVTADGLAGEVLDAPPVRKPVVDIARLN